MRMHLLYTETRIALETARKRLQQLQKSSAYFQTIKLPNSPIGAKIWRMGKADVPRNTVNMSSVCRGMHSIDNDPKMAKIASKNVRIH